MIAKRIPRIGWRVGFPKIGRVSQAKNARLQSKRVPKLRKRPVTLAPDPL